MENNLSEKEKVLSIFTKMEKLHFQRIYNYYNPFLQHAKENLTDLSNKELSENINRATEELLELRQQLELVGSKNLTDMIKWKINEGYGHLLEKPSLEWSRMRANELNNLIQIAKNDLLK